MTIRLATVLTAAEIRDRSAKDQHIHFRFTREAKFDELIDSTADILVASCDGEDFPSTISHFDTDNQRVWLEVD